MPAVTVRVEHVLRQLRLDEEIWRRAVPEGIMVAASEMVPVYVEMSVPKKTGALQKSAQIRISPTRLHIWFDSPYAQYVDEGFPASPGRYIPEPLGKRLIKISKRNPDIGVHPGYKGAHFSEEIANMLKEDLRDIILTIIHREWGV